MSITVGTDTYITIVEADAFMALHYVATDTQLIAWTALSDVNKEVYLRNATIAIDNVYWSGILKDDTQALSFPRCFRDSSYFRDPQNFDPWDYRGYCQSEVPDNVKNAQAHEALEIASPGSDSRENDTINSNVKSYNVTGLSETFAKVNPSSLNDIQDNLKSKKAQRLLTQYAGGGFSVV